MQKQQVLFLALSFITFKSYSQAGMQIGLNATNYKLVQAGMHEKRSTKIGLNAGLLYRTPGKHFCLQPTLLYTQKGAINNDWNINATNVDHYKNRLNYLELSVPVLLKMPVNGPKNTFDIGVGPYLGKLLSAVSKIYYLDGTKKNSKFKIGTAQTDDFKPIDVGLSIYMGVRIHHFYMNMVYDLGLSNVDPITNQSIKNRCFSFNMGALF